MPRTKLTYEIEMKITEAFFRGKSVDAIAEAVGYAPSYIYKIKNKRKKEIFEMFPDIREEHEKT